MNILFIPQLSMYDKITDKFIPQADGNINMLRNTIKEWKQYYNDDKCFVLLPNEEEFLTGLNIDANIIYYNNYVVSARINRYNFPLEEIYHNIKDLKINIIVTDVIELATNLKQMFNIKMGYVPKIISNIRHVDEETNTNYLWRVIDGIYNSDLVTILSQSMKSKLGNQLYGLINPKLLTQILSKIHVFEPSISYFEIELHKEMYEKEEQDKAIITFPGRLSVGEENRTNYDKFIVAINNIRGRRQDFEVYFTDPNNSIGIASKNYSIKNWIKIINKDRKEFLNLLNSTDIVVSLMDIEGFGGISIREALLFNCRPVIPNIHEYKNMADEDYPGFVNSPIEIKDLERALEWAIDSGKKPKLDVYKSFGKKYTIENQFLNIYKKLEDIRNGKSLK